MLALEVVFVAADGAAGAVVVFELIAGLEAASGAFGAGVWATAIAVPANKRVSVFNDVLRVFMAGSLAR